jgi:hypothetical protein
MTPEYKLYHGSVLAEIIDGFGAEISVCAIHEGGHLLSYIIDRRVGLHIKYATQKLRPWHFSFPESHRQILEGLRSKLQMTFLILVCRTDGIIAVHVDEILPALNAASGDQSWLRADRKKREMYRLYGPAGEFPTKFKTNVDPIIDALRQNDLSKT